MKRFKYQIREVYNIGTTENPVLHTEFYEKMIPATEDNEEIAKTEAYNGEYTVEDDGQPEVYQPTESERLDALEAALLEMMGVNVDG